MTESIQEPTQPGTPSPGIRAAMAVAAAIGLAVAGYLAFVSLVLGGAPAGCGGSTGCGEVLASKWSRWAGMPVAVPAVLTYAVALIAIARLGANDARQRAAAWTVLATVGILIAGAATWFIYLQVAVLQAICPYCMVDHAAGLALAALVAYSYTGRGEASRRQLGAAAVLAFVGLAALVGSQWVAPQPIHRTQTVTRLQAATPATAETDPQADAPKIALLGDALDVFRHEEHGLGDPDGDLVIGLMFDYACPHCRRAHGIINAYLDEHPDAGLLVLMVPTPIGPACNPHVPRNMHERFAESCDLARLGLAVHRAAPEQAAAFDAWMFDPELPRSFAEARAHAATLVGPEALEAALADAAVEARLERNIAAYGALGDDSRVPAILIPGQAPVIGSIHDGAMFEEILQEAKTPAPAGAP